ncbi:MAG: hypothetical protein JKY37_33010 [Nannocystaceae bacterium]|nr:hypothetical protein [Nannocystaceae bacterium]
MWLIVALSQATCGGDDDQADGETAAGTETGSTGAAGADGVVPATGQDATSAESDAGSTGATAAATDDDSGSTSDGDAVAQDLPLLPPGAHLGMMVTFEALPDPVAAAVDAQYGDALDAGMLVGRIHLDWADVEPTHGQLLPEELEENLVEMEADGLRPFVGIYALDVNAETLPADLRDAFLAGTPIDDPQIVDRYAQMLDWAVPMIVEHGGWAVSLANEPDEFLSADPAHAQAAAAFYAAARDHVHTLEPELAVTATHTGTAALVGDPFLAVVMASLDFATFNYYPIDIDRGLVLYGDDLADRVSADLDRFIAAAEGKQVVFQELGCPAGYVDTTTTLGATPEIQEAFFAQVFGQLQARPELRVAFVFQMVDWSDELTQLIYGDLLAKVSPPFADNFVEWLRTTGLVTYETGAPRPAWQTFVGAL